MRFYRLHHYDTAEGSQGFEFFTSKQEAAEACRACAFDGNEIEVIEIEPTKAGILKALRQFAQHPDNG